MASNRWAFLTLLSVIRVGMGVQFQSVGAAGPAIRDGLGLDYASLGALAGSYMLLGAAIALPAGWLSARFGDRRILLTGLSLMVAGGVGIAFADSFATALAWRLISGCGAVMLNIVVSKMAMDRFDDASLGLAMGIMLGAWPLGIALGSIFLPYFVDALSWRGIMLASAATCAGFLILAAAALPPASRPATVVRGGFLPGRAAAAVIAAGLVWTFANAGYIILLGFAPTFYVERGYTLAEAGAILSLASLATIPVGPLGGWLGQRFGHPLALTIICIVLVSVGILALLDTAHPAVALLLTGAVLGLPSGLIVALPARVLAPDKRALGMGLFYSVFYVGIGVLAPFAGWLRDITARPEAPFVTAAILNLLAIPALAAFIRLSRRPNGPKGPRPCPSI